MKSAGIVICLFILLLTSILPPISAGEIPNMQVRVYIDSKENWAELKDMHLDQVWGGKNYIEIITDQSELDRISSLGFKTETVHADLTGYLKSRLPARGMGAYKTLDEINAYLDIIVAAYPSIVSSKVSIGQTIEGRDIWAVKISDNPEVDEDEPEVLFASAIHAREVITPEVLLYFMDHLTQNYGTDAYVTDLVDNRELWFILVCNPDGYYYNELIEPSGGGMWRKNRRDNEDGEWGVDLNRNWGYMWGLDDEGSSPYTSSNTYRGTGPFSEPETMNLKLFTEAHDFVIAIYYHSYSNLVLWPWGYDEIYTPDEDIFAAFGDSVEALNGYSPGPGWILYVTNGASDDWYYGEQTTKNKIYGFTFEVGSYEDNFWPPESRIDELISENLAPNLFIADIADRMEVLAKPEAPVVTVADTVPSTEYTVDWTHSDSENPAVEFELNELSNYQVSTDSVIDFTYWLNREMVLSSTRASSAPYSFYSGNDHNSFRHITTAEKYLVQTDDTLRFMIWYDIETDWDYAYVEVSLDGLYFDPIDGSQSTSSDPNGSNRGFGITGSSGGWVEARYDLSGFVGQEIFIRLLYVTDGAAIEEGIYWDDIYPVGIFTEESVYSAAPPDSSYTFASKATGTYFYRLRARDEQNQWSDNSDPVQTQVVQSYVCGDANGDEVVNVGDAVFIINYVFKSGNTPEPLEAGDANCDGPVNVGDAVYLINYVFKGGAAPCDGCP